MGSSSLAHSHVLWAFNSPLVVNGKASGMDSEWGLGGEDIYVNIAAIQIALCQATPNKRR